MTCTAPVCAGPDDRDRPAAGDGADLERPRSTCGPWCPAPASTPTSSSERHRTGTGRGHARRTRRDSASANPLGDASANPLGDEDVLLPADHHTAPTTPRSLPR